MNLEKKEVELAYAKTKSLDINCFYFLTASEPFQKHLID